MHMHTGGSAWDIPSTDSEPGKSKWLAKGSLEEMSWRTDWNYHEGPWGCDSDSFRVGEVWRSLTLPVCLSTWTALFFPPDTCFTTFCLVRILLCKAKGPGSCHWPLVYWLGFSSYCRSPTSISDQETKPHFKPLQAEANQDQSHLQRVWYSYSGVQSVLGCLDTPEVIWRCSQDW